MRGDSSEAECFNAFSLPNETVTSKESCPFPSIILGHPGHAKLYFGRVDSMCPSDAPHKIFKHFALYFLSVLEVISTWNFLLFLKTITFNWCFG